MKIAKKLLTLSLAIALTFVFLTPVSANAACSHSNSIYSGQTQVSKGADSYHTIELVTGWVSCTVTPYHYNDIYKCMDCGAHFPVFSHTTYSHSRYH